MENKLLVVTPTMDLLLPYTRRKIRVRVEPELREELSNFVVTQSLPYLSTERWGNVEYAVIGRILSI